MIKQPINYLTREARGIRLVPGMKASPIAPKGLGGTRINYDKKIKNCGREVRALVFGALDERTSYDRGVQELEDAMRIIDIQRDQIPKDEWDEYQGRILDMKAKIENARETLERRK